jgi:hypothetical protein
LHFTIDPLVRQKAWADLALQPGSLELAARFTGEGMPPIADTFRCDGYGNVVAAKAKNHSLCGYDIDHAFPWSRGGLSEMENARALHAGANRHRNGSRIIIARERMKTGLTPADLRNLFDAVLASVRERTGLDGASLVRAAYQDLKTLCTSSMRLDEGKKGKTIWPSFVASHDLYEDGDDQRTRVKWRRAVEILYMVTKERPPPARSAGGGDADSEQEEEEEEEEEEEKQEGVRGPTDEGAEGARSGNRREWRRGGEEEDEAEGARDVIATRGRGEERRGAGGGE